jgi:hypothetical protein
MFYLLKKKRNCGMFMVNNVGFNCKKAAQVKNWLQKFTGSGC